MKHTNQQNTQNQIKHKARCDIIEERLDAIEQKVGIPPKKYDCTCGCGIPYPPKRKTMEEYTGHTTPTKH